MTSRHPVGVTVEVVGIESNTQGRNCEHHSTCGSLVEEDVVLRLRKVQVIVDGSEETAIAAYVVSDGIDSCRVGFLKRHLVKHWKRYDGALAQVTEVYERDSSSPTKRKMFHHNIGCCLCSIISDIDDGSERRNKRPVEGEEGGNVPKRNRINE